MEKNRSSNTSDEWKQLSYSWLGTGIVVCRKIELIVAQSRAFTKKKKKINKKKKIVATISWLKSQKKP